MSYFLGVDLGTTYSAAAIHRGEHTAITALSDRSPMVPSVLLLRDDETILVGDAANRRAVVEPDRVAREFKRRFGDPAPLILGGSPFGADLLTGRLLRWIVDLVAEREGGLPAGIALTHPANWGDYKLDLLHQAVRRADLDLDIDWVTLSEPQAAATWYARVERIEPDSIVAVYDLGGGTFDAAVLRRTSDGFELLGEPHGIERLGGIDFDAAVFDHVVSALGDSWEALDEDDPQVQASVARVRQECVEAKEALSGDTQAAIPIVVPGLTTEVRLTRAEFEAMIRPALAETVAALRRALRSAGIEADAVDRVLLVGGSSRIPLVGQVVGAELGRPIAVDAHPKHAIALGAASVAAAAATVTDASATGAVPVVVTADPGEDAAVPPPPSPDAASPPTSRVTPPSSAIAPPVSPAPAEPPAPAASVSPAPADPSASAPSPAPATGEPSAPAASAEVARSPSGSAAPDVATADPPDAGAPGNGSAPGGDTAPTSAPPPDPTGEPEPTRVEAVPPRRTASGQVQDPRPSVVVPAPTVPTATLRSPAAARTPARSPAVAARPGPARTTPARPARVRRRRRPLWRRVAAAVTILVLLAAIAAAAVALARKRADDPGADPAGSAPAAAVDVALPADAAPAVARPQPGSR
jgi:hypothetical protein